MRSLAHRFLSPNARKRLGSWARHLGFQPLFLRLRRKGYKPLAGKGLEIGAFEHPAPLPSRCQVRYVDAITPEEAVRLFPEIDINRLVPVDHLVDLDAAGLLAFAAGSLDFIVVCHVIEHVANPGRLIREMVNLLAAGGKLVIAAPDRNYTFDRNRPVTSLDTLKHFFDHGRPAIGPLDYRDIAEFIHPEQLALPEAELNGILEGYRRRREHLSVWTATGFREFLVASFGWSQARMVPCYEVMSERNHFEYFGVWMKR